MMYELRRFQLLKWKIHYSRILQNFIIKDNPLNNKLFFAKNAKIIFCKYGVQCLSIINITWIQIQIMIIYDGVIATKIHKSTIMLKLSLRKYERERIMNKWPSMLMLNKDKSMSSTKKDGNINMHIPLSAVISPILSMSRPILVKSRNAQV